MTNVKQLHARLTIENVLGPLFNEVTAEVEAQIDQWGDQHHPPFRGESVRRQYEAQADRFKQINDAKELEGEPTWDTILLEEVYEAVSEPTPELRRYELIQVVAVALHEIRSLDRLIAEFADEEPEPEPEAA